MVSFYLRVGGGIFSKGAEIGADLVGEMSENKMEEERRWEPAWFLGQTLIPFLWTGFLPRFGAKNKLLMSASTKLKLIWECQADRKVEHTGTCISMGFARQFRSCSRKFPPSHRKKAHKKH